MEISSSALQKSITTFFKRYHVVLYVLVVGGALTGAILTFYTIVSSSEEGGDITSTTSATQFDKDTIERINQLKDRNQNTNTIDFSNGRVNPFVE